MEWHNIWGYSSSCLQDIAISGEMGFTYLPSRASQKGDGEDGQAVGQRDDHLPMEF